MGTRPAFATSVRNCRFPPGGPALGATRALSLVPRCASHPVAVVSPFVLPDELISALEDSYDLDHGFIGQARQRRYDNQALQRLLATLANCPEYREGLIDSRMVRLLWWMPLILVWQIEGLKTERKPTSDFERAATAVEKELARILGPA